MGSIPNFPQRLTLRLYNPSPEDEANMEGATLGDWFRGYFLPVVMQAERQNAAETISMYETAVAYWEQSPAAAKPLASLSKVDLAAFQLALDQLRWTRGASGDPRPLSASSKFKQITIILRILLAAFEEGLLPKRIKYSPRRPQFDRKESYSLDECRALWKVLDQARLPAEHSNCQAFWRCLIAGLFYTGLRVGAVLSLKKSFFSTRKGQRWLIVPGSANKKTRKEWEGPVHPLLAETVDRIETDELFAGTWRQDVLSKEAKRLAKLAGIASPMAFHVWRRVHGEQLGELGAGDALRAAQSALQHSSAETTRQSYYDPRHTFLLMLPRLDS
jgi:integrase